MPSRHLYRNLNRSQVVGEQAPITPPVNTVAPVLSGNFFVGQTLSCSSGTWSGSPSYTYQWRNTGVDIVGATSSTYTVQAGDDADLLDCIVTATNGAGSTPQASSNSFYGIQLALWLDASDSSTITQTAGAVSQWNDKSGNGQDLTQTTGTRQPITGTRTVNSLNVIDFDGVDDGMGRGTATNLGGGDYTIFTITYADTATSGRRIITKGNHWGLSVGESGSPSQADASYGNTSSAVNSRGATTVTSTARILGARRSSSSQFLFSGSTDHSAATANNVTGGQLAIASYNNSSAYFDGTIGEILVGQRSWTTAERNQVASYLTAKWGVSWTAR